MVEKDVILVGIIAILILESIALLKGIDGIILSIVLSIIAGAIGVHIPTPKYVKGGK